MKRIFAVLLVFCMSLLVFTGCSSSSDNSAIPQNNPIGNVAQPNTPQASVTSSATYEDFLTYLRSDYAFKSFRFYGEDGNIVQDYYIEIYSDVSYSYFSLISETEKLDYIIRYNTNYSAGDKPCIFAEGEWVNNIGDMNSFDVQIAENILSIITTDGNAVDNTFDLHGKTFPCKQILTDNNIYIDYLCRDGKWDAVSISSVEDGYTMILENFRFADAPSSDSRIALTLNAPENNEVTYYKITSNSMYPALEMGQTYRFEKVDFNTIEVGDIVLANYKQDGFSFTLAHRVVEITNEGLILCGDANNSINDPYPYTEDNVYGVLVEE